MAEHPSHSTAGLDGCPGYVRGWCCKARERTLRRGYRDVGYLLAARLRRFRPEQFPVEAWPARLATLGGFFDRHDDAAATDWFRETYPRLMALIPAGAHGEFVAGAGERRRP
jgi:hypothetical protein